MIFPARTLTALIVSVLALVGTFAAVVLPGARAGDVSDGGTPVLTPHAPVVVIGTQGLRWQDVRPDTTPHLWRLLDDGAPAGGITPAVTSASASCSAAGWLSLSAGRTAITGAYVDDVWQCAEWDLVAEGTGARLDGWAGLVGLQADSEFRPHPGTLGAALASTGECTTAIGPGAALALASSDGTVERYRAPEVVQADPEDAFACPLTVVDAGAVPYHRDPTADAERVPIPADATADGPLRDTELQRLDERVGALVEAAPSEAFVVLADVGNPAPGRRSLGVGVVVQPDAAEGTPGYLTSGATRWLGVFRLLDVPTTLVRTAGAPIPADFTGASIAIGDARPDGSEETTEQLAALSIRDDTLRGSSGVMTGVPTVLALAALCIIVLFLPKWQSAGRNRSPVPWERALEVLLLWCAAASPAIFLVGAVPWWQWGNPTVGLWVTWAVLTTVIAGIGALVPRRPLWAGPALLAAFTFALLTIDALLGTPLHRASPLGAAPTLGGRYYGFGNPTYSVYVVAAVLAAAGLATLVTRRWGKVAGAIAVVLVGGVATFVDLWPTLGADVGGALVLLPVFAVLALAALGARVTWRRLLMTAVGGIVLVGAVGIVDWLRPAEHRTHLGTFVQQVVDGTAAEILLRKAGYAFGSLLAGPAAWLTLVIVVWIALALYQGSRVRAGWLEGLTKEWPLLRPALVSLVLAAVAGGIVNDYGIRIATQMLFTAVPLVALGQLRRISSS
ncbi:hypothetical protein AB1046_17465 [Promicromonospora sp. Populi]|uniref:hypothetical protein n=1 Tax=Promicromonospora sp. Populi TaxID=3239420 RepID=UPI0034E28063